MFNPQKKCQLVDLYMDQRSLRMHRQQIQRIHWSNESRDTKIDRQFTQRQYLSRLNMSKQQVKSRLDGSLRSENQAYFNRVQNADRTLKINPELQKAKQKRYFNSFVNSKKAKERIKQQNNQQLQRLMNRSSKIPSFDSLRQDYQKTQKYMKIRLKHPLVTRYQQQIKRDLSLSRITNKSKDQNLSRQSHRRSDNLTRLSKLQKQLISQ